MRQLRFNKFTKVITATAIIGVSLANVMAVSALSLTDVFSGPYRGEGQPASLFDGPAAIIPRVINIMLFIVGILAVFMMIYGGIRYVLSGGDNGKVKDAKNTILYAIIGLVVAILGYALVGWVVSMIGTNGTVPTPAPAPAPTETQPQATSLLVTTLLG